MKMEIMNGMNEVMEMKEVGMKKVFGSCEEVYDWLVEWSVYDCEKMDVYGFRHGSDVRNGRKLAVGNMVKGYGFDMMGRHWNNSEAAYIAGMFSFDNEAHRAVQRELLANDNGFSAKKVIRRKNEALMREDWEEYNVQWMLYVVWSKCLSNKAFARMLRYLPSDCVIVEDTSAMAGVKNQVWGAKNLMMKKLLKEREAYWSQYLPTKKAVKAKLDEERLGELSRVGVFEGKNIMGKILMLCRDALKGGYAPLIDYNLLRERHINILGNEVLAADKAA